MPAKCPEVNPQENVWQFMRDNWLSNRIFRSYDQIVDHCCDAWNKLTDQPWRIMSTGMREWAERVSNSQRVLVSDAAPHGFSSSTFSNPRHRQPLLFFTGTADLLISDVEGRRECCLNAHQKLSAITGMRSAIRRNLQKSSLDDARAVITLKL